MNWFKWKSIGNTMVFNINSSGFFWDFPWNHPLKIKVPWIENDIGKTHSFFSRKRIYKCWILHIYAPHLSHPQKTSRPPLVAPKKEQIQYSCEYWSASLSWDSEPNIDFCTSIMIQILTFALRLWSKYWLLHFDYDPNIDFCTSIMIQILTFALRLWSKYWLVQFDYDPNIDFCTSIMIQILTFALRLWSKYWLVQFDYDPNIDFCTSIMIQILTCAIRLWSKYWLLHFDYDPNIDFCTSIMIQILTCAIRLWSKYWLLHFDYDPNIDFCTSIWSKYWLLQFFCTSVDVSKHPSILHVEVSIHGVSPKWMVYVMENPIKWMMTGGTPMTSETST